MNKNAFDNCDYHPQPVPVPQASIADEEDMWEQSTIPHCPKCGNPNDEPVCPYCWHERYPTDLDYLEYYCP